MKEYFSKLRKKWVPLKTTDSEKKLKECGYKIRDLNSESELPFKKEK